MPVIIPAMWETNATTMVQASLGDKCKMLFEKYLKQKSLGVWLEWYSAGLAAQGPEFKP
jgi:hypothetical protein